MPADAASSLTVGLRCSSATLTRDRNGSSSWLSAGTAEWVVSRRLGHAHVQTTLDIYGWVREDEALRAAANWTSYASTWRVHDEG